MIRNSDKFLEAINFVSNLTGTSTRKILSKKRDRDYVVSRHFLRYYLRTKFDMRFRIIGELTNCHHATVIHSIKFVNDYSIFDKTLKGYKDSVDNLSDESFEDKYLRDYLKLKEEVIEILDKKNSNHFKCSQLLTLINKENESSRAIK